MRKASLTSGQRLRRKGQGRERRAAAIENLIVIGGSAGGYDALIHILRDLSPDIPAAIVLLLHSSSDSGHALRDSLARLTTFRIVTVEDSEPLRHGVAYLPPPCRSMSFRRGVIRVESLGNMTHPSTMINRTLQSAARAYGHRAIGVILTGLLRDGTDGLKAVHDAGGLTMVQNPRDAKFADMPANAMEELPVTFCLNLSDLGPALDLLARRDTRLETGVAVSVRFLKERVALLVRLIGQSTENEGTYRYLMFELARLKRDLDSISGLLKKAPKVAP